MASPYSFTQQEYVLIALTRFFCSSAKSKQEFKFQKSGFIGIHAVSLSIISELVIAENCTESYYLNNPSENAFRPPLISLSCMNVPDFVVVR